MEQKFTIKIKFVEAELVLFATSTKEEEAIGLALSLHRASNVVHSIFVESGESVICVLNSYE